MADTLDDVLKDAVFVVEADRFAQCVLWERFHDKVDWQESSCGFLVEVGQIQKHPISLCIFTARLNGKRVVFYEATSRMVDWRKIEKWFKEHCWPKWDNGKRRAHCDAMNFSHCLNVVGYQPKEKRIESRQQPCTTEVQR